jgi:hypothetical protein
MKANAGVKYRLPVQVVKEIKLAAVLLPMCWASFGSLIRQTMVVSDASDTMAGVGIGKQPPPARLDMHMKLKETVHATPVAAISCPTKEYFSFFNYSFSPFFERKQIAVKELHALTTAIRSLSVNQLNQNETKIIVAFIDNTAIIHAIEKGRSRCPIINRQLRFVAGLCMVYNMRLELHYVPSLLNPADKWSRMDANDLQVSRHPRGRNPGGRTSSKRTYYQSAA